MHAGEKDGPQMSSGISWEESAFVGLLMTRALAALAIVPFGQFVPDSIYLSSAPLPFRSLKVLYPTLRSVC